jgi:tight adherence protein C
MIILAALLTFVSVLFFVYSFGMRRTGLMELRLEVVKLGLRPREATMSQPFMNRAVAPALLGFENFLLKLLPVTWVKATSQRLVWSGLAIRIEGFVLIWAISTVMFTGLAYFIGSDVGLSTFWVVVATLGGAAFGVFAPQYWLSARIAGRHYILRKALPDALDLMVTSVEAGLSLDAALARVCEHHSGPLQRELDRALQDMNYGQARRDALDGMASRTNLPELTAFINTLNQAEVTGAPIGRVLRVQAEQVRVSRRQAAEAQAQRAPLLMIVPLVFFIFPSLFVVLLGPALLSILEILQNSELFN